MDKIKITHFSDILCIWAYVSQHRIDELIEQFDDKIQLDYHFFPVFGDVHRKIFLNWKDRGGIKGYHNHVASVSESHPHLNIHPKLWIQPTPTSSLPCHLYLCATRLLEEQGLIPSGSLRNFIKTIRQAFFNENRNISEQAVILDIVESSTLPTAEVKELIENGQAYAALSYDIQTAQNLSIPSSPTLIFNENRQRLSGDVGYKIIEANIKELIEQPVGGQSWC